MYSSYTTISISRLEICFSNVVQIISQIYRIASILWYILLGYKLFWKNGNAGRRIVEKVLKADHQVTGVVRRESAIEGLQPTVFNQSYNSGSLSMTGFIFEDTE